MRKIELLAPAHNVEVGMAAISHGADAVYIGASSHGARQAAANSVDEIRKLADFAHIYRARVYVTVNTLVYDNELPKVESLIWDLYHAGVDAILVQDMGLLRLNLPPIELHASTQCDIRTPEKARFLEQVGFSQVVLARELTIDEIKSICESVSVPVETFVHGALCVSYSGRCNASQYCLNRSANRGECAQMCRLPYNLVDVEGRVVVRNKHLLSLHDYNAENSIEDLLEAGASSLKIEGRLKDAEYVKNIVSNFSDKLDAIISKYPDRYQRASLGRREIEFNPNPYKSFNRGFTEYFLHERRPNNLASINTPKSLGEPLHYISDLNNGDGIAFFDNRGNYIGVRVNSIVNGSIRTFGNVRIPANARLYRTSDRVFDETLKKSSPKRRLWIDVEINDKMVTSIDERGVRVSVAMEAQPQEGVKNADKVRNIFGKLGNTHYYLRNFSDTLAEDIYLPPSQLTELRRRLTSLLDSAARATYTYARRRKEDFSVSYPIKELYFADNVANKLSERFYESHGAAVRQKAMEVKCEKRTDMVLMTCRYCLLRELGSCMKQGKPKFKLPLALESGQFKFNLRFNCDRCEMLVCS